MITFSDRGFTVTVETSGNPLEAWQNLQESIIDCFRASDPGFFSIDDARPLLDFLRELQPDWKLLKKMTT